MPIASDKIPTVKHRSNLPVREAGPVTDSWPRIFYRKHNGWWCYEIDERINGSGRRTYRQTEEKARERAKWVKDFHARGVKAEDLDIETLAFLKEAKIKLQTLGYGLREALNGYSRHRPRRLRDRPDRGRCRTHRRREGHRHRGHPKRRAGAPPQRFSPRH